MMHISTVNMLCFITVAVLVMMMVVEFLMVVMEFLMMVVGFRRLVRTSILPVEPKGEGAEIKGSDDVRWYPFNQCEDVYPSVT